MKAPVLLDGFETRGTQTPIRPDSQRTGCPRRVLPGLQDALNPKP